MSSKKVVLAVVLVLNASNNRFLVHSSGSQYQLPTGVVCLKRSPRKTGVEVISNLFGIQLDVTKVKALPRTEIGLCTYRFFGTKVPNFDDVYPSGRPGDVLATFSEQEALQHPGFHRVHRDFLLDLRANA